MEVKAMRKTTWFFSCLLLAIASLFLPGKSTGNGRLSVQNRDSSLKSSFSAHPYTGKGYESRPIVVTSVRSEIKARSVNAVRILNISSKPAAGVKLGWTLSKENAQDRILEKGETPLVPIPHGLAVKEDKVLDVPIVSFLDLKKNLKEKSEGDYRVDVRVTEILFDDGSQWNEENTAGMKQSGEAVIIKIALGKTFVPLTVTPFKPLDPCAKQKCRLMEGPPDAYTCDGSNNQEFCTNCSTSCCDTLCGSSPACNCH